MMYAVDVMAEIAYSLWRVLWFPIKAAAWLLRMVTYLIVLALIAGVLIGLWSSGVRPW